MPVSLQVAYPTRDDTTFDYDYYLTTHMGLVAEHMGPHIQNTVVTKGLAGGPDTPPPFHAIATIVFADQNAMNAAMKASGPVVSDIPNFYNSAPQMLIGEVVG
ncbi:EthD family reductase [Ruegeria pomeroyi]|jgi:uncharacterized protein (TIGR02118 family)|uniref:EthD domain-containing protein n=2 Tax=Ruegeria pomeroyi TaxID=89184 RepID=Q5LXA1_RUEPO|nr:EthD family reductase [Ruegeria pomeroyi]HCE71089.1 EthD family reductase [Ruegeria sp.]AAV93633.1 hypothetical protein SPO0315 [Ruegeria pomeroyi DSS-3]NVK99359.1 EthD family reductase [Ruegeria pomeroyi]NVL01257.1 EthD family reductase [Ruegeria pomeroyi]QWV07223.1 EthD family reductase [Ruegeria pomeroyi]